MEMLFKMKLEFKFIKESQVDGEYGVVVVLILSILAFFSYGVWIGFLLEKDWLVLALPIGTFFVVTWLSRVIARINIRRVK